MFVRTVLRLYVCLLCDMLTMVIADVEHTQHAGHVHTAHEIDGKHNVEFDHEAILGKRFCFHAFVMLGRLKMRRNKNRQAPHSVLLLCLLIYSLALMFLSVCGLLGPCDHFSPWSLRSKTDMHIDLGPWCISV